ncbi:hypothetical protein NUH86_19530 [Sphingobium sp. JS3065]|nr:hypothetical protein [Sphingobium sp. JS3065]UZW57759.1 hypothetical protein NUH86_19530 [Sphingobium sp. JS3065]
MSLLPLLIIHWHRFRAAARQEFLRDPNVILFERTASQRESAGGR